MKINILLPFPPNKPAGGVRVMYEYANYLADMGHTVNVYHTVRCSYMSYKYPFWVRLFFFKVFAAPRWFKIRDVVSTHLIASVSDKNIKNADVLVYTWWALGYDVQRLSSPKGRLFSIIQDLEFWAGYEDKVKESFFFKNIQKIVISEHIRKYIYELGGRGVEKVSFAIDDTLFFLKRNIEERNPQTICMMYSLEPRKGSKHGLSALLKLKGIHPLLKVNLFGVCEAPPNLPSGFTFHHNPKNLSDIMNDCALFLGPSVQEGCALPPMEAMHSGCALVCTAIEGHSEYAFHKDTAILFESENMDSCVDAMDSLINNESLRILIAKRGNAYIRKNTWKSSTGQLEAIFKRNV